MRYNSITVGTTPVRLPLGKGDVVLVVNNGETVLYFGNTSDVDAENGLPMGPSIGYEFDRNLESAGWNDVWVVSDGEGGDVRYASVG